jgi:hypothetical protein
MTEWHIVKIEIWIFKIIHIRGAQIFHKSENHSKILGAKKWHEANSILRTHNIIRHRRKFTRHGDLVPGICAPLMYIILSYNFN